jgi:phage terminase large subunit-like protein
MFSGDEPERLRGPQHHGAWVDELAAFRYPETWDQLQFGLRLGDRPQAVVTTTPKPRPLIRSLMSRDDGTVVVTRGSTFDNVKNLAPSAIAEFVARYEGTRLGRQELHGELLDDIEGALWKLADIERFRVRSLDNVKIVRRVVSVDPAVTANIDSDETGIVVVARDREGHGYVEADLSMKGTPNEWAMRVIRVFDEYECDNIVVEVNQGGDMVAQTLRTVRAHLPIREVRASKGKRLRAEPISSLYEQGRVHHVGVLDKLETQMTTWTPDDPKSPDRLDALVHGLTELMDGGGAEAYLRSLALVCACGYPNTQGAESCSHCNALLRAG